MLEATDELDGVRLESFYYAWCKKWKDFFLLFSVRFIEGLKTEFASVDVHVGSYR